MAEPRFGRFSPRSPYLDLQTRGVKICDATPLGLILLHVGNDCLEGESCVSACATCFHPGVCYNHVEF